MSLWEVLVRIACGFIYTAKGASNIIVYIAGPYTAGEPVLNVITAIKAAEQVRNLGHLPFVPHLTHLWHLVSPHPYEYWIKMGLEWLEICDCIIRLPGESQGADDEVDSMIAQCKPIFYSVEEFERIVGNETLGMPQ